MAEPSRNQPCPCGSGLRFKECHGRVAEISASEAESLRQKRCSHLMEEALAHQQRRRNDEAERLYRAALEILPDQPDALHMLGVICYERGDLVRAKALVLRALDLTAWRHWTYRHNLGLILTQEYAAHGWDPAADRTEAYRQWHVASRASGRRDEPRVSVIVPSFNHSRYIERAIRSIFEQTYRNVELVVIDDGSVDGSPSVIERCLRDSPFPSRFLARENRGAPATINEGIDLATGTFVNVVNSDDWLAPRRLQVMVAEIANTGENWGFSSVTFVDAAGEIIDPLKNRRVYDLTCAIAALPTRRTTGFALLSMNVSISSGNLFMSRQLFREIEGFRQHRYNHDWDFCLRALQAAEPVFVREPLYFYRLHGSNTIDESIEQASVEMREICSDYLRWVGTGAKASGPFAPCIANWGSIFMHEVLESTLPLVVDIAILRELALANPQHLSRPVGTATGE